MCLEISSKYPRRERFLLLPLQKNHDYFQVSNLVAFIHFFIVLGKYPTPSARVLIPFTYLSTKIMPQSNIVSRAIFQVVAVFEIVMIFQLSLSTRTFSLCCWMELPCEEDQFGVKIGRKEPCSRKNTPMSHRG